MMDRLVLKLPFGEFVSWEIHKATRSHLTLLVARSPWGDSIQVCATHYGEHTTETVDIARASVFMDEIPPGHLLVLKRLRLHGDEPAPITIVDATGEQGVTA